jgi:hypothetical protein
VPCQALVEAAVSQLRPRVARLRDYSTGITVSFTVHLELRKALMVHSQGQSMRFASRCASYSLYVPALVRSRGNGRGTPQYWHYGKFYCTSEITKGARATIRIKAGCIKVNASYKLCARRVRGHDHPSATRVAWARKVTVLALR